MGIEIGAFRAIAQDNTIDETSEVYTSNDEKTTLGTGQPHDVRQIDTKEDSSYIRQQLLEHANQNFGGVESDAFKTIEKILFGEQKDGKYDVEFSQKPLLKRDIVKVLDKIDSEVKTVNLEDQATGKRIVLEKDKLESMEFTPWQGVKDEPVPAQEVKTGATETVAQDEKLSPDRARRMLEQIQWLASYAKGKWEGADGGEGFLGMLENGEIVKFLTHSGERKDFDKGLFDALPDQDKEMINKATEKLRAAILEIVEGLDAETREQVAGLLKGDEKKNGFDPFVSRKTVAAIVTLVAEKIGTVDGKSFDWEGVVRAETVDETTFDDVFPTTATMNKVRAWLDAEKKKENEWYEKEKGASGSVNGTTIKEHFHARLKDKTFTREAARMMKHVCKLTKASDLGKIGKDDKALRPCTRNPFRMVGGSSSAVIDKMIEEYGEGNVAVQVFADCTHCGGGIDTGGQEEGNTRDIAVELLGFLTGMGFTEVGMNPNGLDSKVHVNYTIDQGSGKSKLSSAWGYLVTGMKRLTNQVMKGAAQKVKYLFSAMPSFHHSYNKDVHGTVDWLSKCQKYLADRDLTPAQMKNVRSVVESIFRDARVTNLMNTHSLFDWGASEAQEGSGDFGKKVPTQFSEMMMILTFSIFKEDEPKPFDMLNDSPQQVRDKLIDLMESGDYKELLENAKKNYESTLRQSVRTWIKMLHDQGVKCLVSGAAGCGFFKNPSPVLARILAEEFVENGGDLPFVFAKYSENDPDAPIWEAAFRAAWAKHEAKMNGTEYVEEAADEKAQPPVLTTTPSILVDTNQKISTLGSQGGLGTADAYLMGGSDTELPKQLREMLDNAGDQITDFRSGIAFVLNKFTTSSEYLQKGVDDKTKAEYLKFITNAKKTLSIKNASEDWIKSTFKGRDVRGIRNSALSNRISAAIKVVDEFLADRAKKASETAPVEG